MIREKERWSKEVFYMENIQNLIFKLYSYETTYKGTTYKSTRIVIYLQ